jgi:hypothetical protein
MSHIEALIKKELKLEGSAVVLVVLECREETILECAERGGIRLAAQGRNLPVGGRNSSAIGVPRGTRGTRRTGSPVAGGCLTVRGTVVVVSSKVTRDL